MIRVGVVGISGFTGEVLLKVLANHQGADVRYCVSGSHKGKKLQEVYPSLKNVYDLTCQEMDVHKIQKECDVIFLCVPHTTSMQITPQLLKAGKKVIDLSGDYRLKDTAVFEKFYHSKHTDKVNLKTAVYGLPELNRKKVKTAFLIANPGCYPTVTILSLYPLLKEKLIATDTIVVDAKSGVTGAGRKAAVEYHYSSINENFYLYRPVTHQHVPEIEEYLGVFSNTKKKVIFVPHLLPLDRGIYMTACIFMKKNVSEAAIVSAYRKCYEKEPFVRLLPGTFPQLKNVTGTNFCDIGFQYFKERNVLVVAGSIDNLMKGASSQAVQNMNIMYGYEETEGLL